MTGSVQVPGTEMPAGCAVLCCAVHRAGGSNGTHKTERAGCQTTEMRSTKVLMSHSSSMQGVFPRRPKTVFSRDVWFRAPEPAQDSALPLRGVECRSHHLPILVSQGSAALSCLRVKRTLSHLRLLFPCRRSLAVLGLLPPHSLLSEGEECFI